MVKLSNATIDELVSGGLAEEQYRDVLRKLEEEPGAWKRCALAFLEDQALQQDLAELAQDCSPGRGIWTDASAHEQLSSVGESNAGMQAQASLRSQPDRAPTWSQSRLDWISRLTSLAALLLVSFTIGWFGSSLREGGSTVAPPEQLAASPPTSAETAAGASGLLPNYEGPNYEGKVSRGSRLVSQPGYFPEGVIPWEPQPPEYLEQLHRSGRIELDYSDVFVPVDDVLVPVRQYNVRPKVFSY